MASVTIREKAQRIDIRAYAGKDPVTGKVRNLYRRLPINASAEEIAKAKKELDITASFCRDQNVSFTIEGALEYRLALGKSIGYAESSIEGYKSYIRCYVSPSIGNMAIDKLRPYHIESLYNTLMSEGGKDKKPVSEATIKTFHAFMRKSFRSFVKDGLIPYNPFDSVDLPKRVRHEAVALFDADFKAVMDYLTKEYRENHTPLAAALLLCVRTGMSRGELAGLFVSDYRPRAKTIRVSRALSEAGKSKNRVHYKEPKAETRNRTLPLSEPMREILNDHIRHQADRLSEVGIKQNSSTPMFTQESGKPYRPGAYTEYFRKIRKKLGLPSSVHLHTLRHTHATYLIEAGENIKTVSEHMGHSNVKTTVDVYTHTLPGRNERLAETFENTIRSGL